MAPQESLPPLASCPATVRQGRERFPDRLTVSPRNAPQRRVQRSQANALDAALAHSIDAFNLLRTAEAALIEIGALLRELEELVQAAAEHSLEAEERCGLQREAESLLEALDGIAGHAAYGNTKLLDGSAGVSATAVDDKHILSATPTPDTPAGYVDLETTQAASRAVAVCATTYASPTEAVKGHGEVTVNGVHVGEFAPATHTVADVLAGLAEAGARTGVVPAWVDDHVELRHIGFGSSSGIVLTETGPLLNEGHTLVRYGEDAVALAMYGDGSMERLDAGTGLALRGRRSGFVVVLTEAGNRAALTLPRVAYVTRRELSIRLGGERPRRLPLSLPGLASAHLGGVVPLSTLDLSTAAGASDGIAAVSEALEQVEGLRAELARVRHEEILPNVDELADRRRDLRPGHRLTDPELARELAEVICHRIALEPAAAAQTQAHCLPHNVVALLR